MNQFHKNLKKILVDCPLCDSNNFFTIYPENSKHSRIVQCRQCNLFYSNPQLNVSKFYEKESPYHDFYMLYLKGRFKTFEHKFKVIQNYIPKGKLLDIGCGAGISLKVAQDMGWNADGIEPNIDSVKWAKEVLNININIGSFESTLFNRSEYDLITLFSTFEHLKNPNTVLMRIYDFLKPNGYLAIEIPNIETIQSKIFKDNYRHFISAHYWFFTRQTIKLMLQKWNFKIIHFGYSIKFFQLNYLLQMTSHYYCSNRILKYMLNFMRLHFTSINFDPIIPYNLHDDYFIIALKK